MGAQQVPGSREVVEVRREDVVVLDGGDGRQLTSSAASARSGLAEWVGREAKGRTLRRGPCRKSGAGATSSPSSTLGRAEGARSQDGRGCARLAGLESGRREARTIVPGPNPRSRRESASHQADRG